MLKLSEDDDGWTAVKKIFLTDYKLSFANLFRFVLLKWNKPPFSSCISDEGPTLETLHLLFISAVTQTFLYFDLKQTCTLRLFHIKLKVV